MTRRENEGLFVDKTDSSNRKNMENGINLIKITGIQTITSKKGMEKLKLVGNQIESVAIVVRLTI